MGGMPGFTAANSPILRAIKKFTANEPTRRSNLERALNALQPADSVNKLEDIGKTLLNLEPDEVTHLKRDWFDDATRWWQDRRNPKTVVRQGFLDAINQALTEAPSLPVTVKWDCRREADPEVSVNRGSRKVTVTICTPRSPEDPPH